MPHLTPEAKAKLSATIRSLRDRLLTDLHHAVEGTYRLSLPLAKAGLAEEQHVKRQRLEQWLDEQVRAEATGQTLKDEQRQEIWERHLRSAEKLAAATLLNRLIVIKQMEAMGLIKPVVVTGGWQSRGYKEFRDFAPDLCRDETEGFGTLLQLLYDELALEMPGLFGRVNLTSLFPVPASTLRTLVEALDEPMLHDAWLDDTTLGWVYQYWNDPEREELDAKLNSGGKVEPHEVASKTQMFTERYMVEWLLHNSLGQMWLAICKVQGWTAEVEADGTLDRLESRRKVWREKREMGEVALDALMPIESEIEDRWKYWVPQPLPSFPQPPSPQGEGGVGLLLPSPSGRGVGGEGQFSASLPHPLAPSPIKGEGEQEGSAPLSLSERRVGGEGLSSASLPHPLAPSPIKGEGGQEGSAPLSRSGRGVGGEGSIRNIKILDLACGSGHFLVIAFGLLFALYQEEARHRGEDWSDRAIVESILTNNLYGIDIDARSVQIAAAALFLKAKSLCRSAELTVVNLVAADLNLSALSEDDPALVELRREVQEATGIPEALTNQIVQALKGADQWGSLLKIDREVEQAIAQYELSLVRSVQGELEFDPHPLAPSPWGEGEPNRGEDEPNPIMPPSPSGRGVGGEGRMAILLEKLESFLNRRTRGDDLGLRLRGEQLTAGVRFMRLLRENAYDLVIGNPPYQGSSKLDDAKYLVKHYPKGKADLYAAFLERGLQLAKPGGFSALVTMRNWMFIQQFTAIREYLLEKFDLRSLGDFDRGAFDEVPNEVLAVTLSIFQKGLPNGEVSIAIQPTALDDNSYDRQRTNRKRSAILAQVGRFEFKSDRFAVIKEKPIVYWWDDEFCQDYTSASQLGSQNSVSSGTSTGNNLRFCRYFWEVDNFSIHCCTSLSSPLPTQTWQPFINGGKGRKWIEPLLEIVNWKSWGLACRNSEASRTINLDFNWKPGVAFVMIGSEFSARVHRYRSICGNKGSSVFSSESKTALKLLAVMNSYKSKQVMASLNPGIGFEVGDIKRLPLFPIESADEIFAQLDRAFTEHESARETSVEFQQPGASCWNYAQQWAQQAVDREPGAPLPDWNPVYDQPLAVQWVSYAIGVAIGRFGANGEGTLTPFSLDGRGVGGEGKASAFHPHPLAPSPLMGEGGQEGGGQEGEGQEGGGQEGGGQEGEGQEGEGQEQNLNYWEVPTAIKAKMTEVARQFRKEPTPSEKTLWGVLRKRQLENRKFRRQQPIGLFIVDFFCASERLIVEVDGLIHESQRELDRQRQELLESLGLRFVRVTAQQVENDISGTLETIRQAFVASSNLSHPHPLTPSPIKGEGEQEGSATFLRSSISHFHTPIKGEGEQEGSAPLSRPGRGVGGEGILPHGILYLSAYSGDRPNSKDSLTHPACQSIHAAWSEHGSAIVQSTRFTIAKKSLRDWLRLSFFKDVHLGMYEQRPIYFPLSSKTRNFVAYISIHRWTDTTLQTLLADYLVPELRDLEGETADLLASQSKGDRKAQAQAEERRATVQALFSELQAFIQLVQQCAEQGTPAASPKDIAREANARFQMDLDDGVMVNSAALWCLLEPQWNKPKIWWSELCNAKGKKDYDWSHLAARYFPDRVDAKCQKDPSLAVAHGVFWNYHPAKAYEWELRLQDEIAPDFTINEANSDQFRAEFEASHPQLVLDLRAKEEKRRDRKYKKTDQLDLEAIEPDLDTDLEDRE